MLHNHSTNINELHKNIPNAIPEYKSMKHKHELTYLCYFRKLMTWKTLKEKILLHNNINFIFSLY